MFGNLLQVLRLDYCHFLEAWGRQDAAAALWQRLPALCLCSLPLFSAAALLARRGQLPRVGMLYGFCHEERAERLGVPAAQPPKLLDNV